VAVEHRFDCSFCHLKKYYILPVVFIVVVVDIVVVVNDVVDIADICVYSLFSNIVVTFPAPF
jgi:hypothetical protein